MERYVLSFGGESLVVKEKTDNSHRVLHWAIAGLILLGLIVTAILFAMFFKSPAG